MENRAPPSDFGQAFIDDFYRLYDKYVEERFRHALPNLTGALNALLDARFPTSQRMRLRVEQGRIKGQNRLLLKAQTEKYRPEIQTPEDIFVVVRDIVGTRVTCNTLADVYAVVENIKSCADSNNAARTLSRLHEDWEDDYILKPKDTGYRAINLIVGVPVPRGGLMVPVTCEIQIRTLLQHAWGELTHEDTYKPGVKVPELVQVLMKRLATTLAVLDEIAQDLRGELDKVERLEDQAQAPAEVAQTEKEATEEQPSSRLQETAGEPPPQPEPPAQVTVEQTKQLSRDDLFDAFRTAFDREPKITGDGLAIALKELDTAGFLDPAKLVAALTGSRETVKELEAGYEKVQLTDLGRLRAVIQLSQDREKGVAWVKDVLNATVERVRTKEAEKQTFESTYPDGREALGTVVFATGDYALVQLPEGDTGILHATQMKVHPTEYVTVSERVREGDTVRVRVLKTNPETKRIELQFIR